MRRARSAAMKAILYIAIGIVIAYVALRVMARRR